MTEWKHIEAKDAFDVFVHYVELEPVYITLKKFLMSRPARRAAYRNRWRFMRRFR
jgi:hypothetical protein